METPQLPRPSSQNLVCPDPRDWRLLFTKQIHVRIVGLCLNKEPAFV